MIRRLASYPALKVIAIALGFLFTFSSLAGSSGGTNTRYSGQATAVRATVLGINTTISDTGSLSSSGGSLERSLLTASVPQLLTAQVLHATTIGQGNHSRAESSVANLNLTVGGHTIAASFLMARAAASCSNGKASLSGTSHIAALTLDGNSVAVGTGPNQTILLPNGKVILNEQAQSGTTKSKSMTVNAIHVIINGIADVIVSSAHADINCGTSQCAAGDFFTGGGWTTATPSGSRGNFGVAGGLKNAGLWGHLVFHDKGSNIKVKGTGITAYTITGATSRRVQGTCQINGQNGFTYRVDVADNGEPGRNDTFELQLSNGYTASGNLSGGNIQLHLKTCR